MTKEITSEVIIRIILIILLKHKTKNLIKEIKNTEIFEKDK